MFLRYREPLLCLFPNIYPTKLTNLNFLSRLAASSRPPCPFHTFSRPFITLPPLRLRLLSLRCFGMEPDSLPPNSRRSNSPYPVNRSPPPPLLPSLVPSANNSSSLRIASLPASTTIVPVHLQKSSFPLPSILLASLSFFRYTLLLPTPLKLAITFRSASPRLFRSYFSVRPHFYYLPRLRTCRRNQSEGTFV